MQSLAPGVSEQDLTLLRRSFALAARGMSTGERPFGAVIVDKDGHIVAEAYAITHAQKDITCHAEVTAIRTAYAQRTRDDLAGCTLYSSAEPCAMCSGAIYWANIRRVVFGLTEPRLRALRKVAHATSLQMRCAAVLATGERATDVVGGVLEDEAIVSHLTFWQLDATTAGAVAAGSTDT